MNSFSFLSLGRRVAQFFLTLSLLAAFTTSYRAQTADPAAAATTVEARIERARALIAAHHLETAASELESVRGLTQDSSVRSITSVMLMGVYLEAGNYGRAEALLEENFAARSTQNGDSLRTYYAMTGQAVNGARSHIARYRTLGINTTDSNLPAEAASDLDRLRSFLERMIAQARQIATERKAHDSLSLLEDVVGIRLSLARDMEDQVKWQTEYSSAREVLASQTQATPISALPPTKAGLGTGLSSSPYSTRRPSDTSASPPDAPVPAPVAGPIRAPSTGDVPKGADAQLSLTGSLNSRATKRVVPPYPAFAKKAGATGLVRVHVIVDERGKVTEVSKTEGPALLRQAAEDAARQWAFEAPVFQGKPTRWSGYIDFNFTL